MITGVHPSRKRDNRIQSMAKVYYHNDDEEELWVMAIGFGVSKRTANDYVVSAIILSKIARKKGLFET